MEPILCLKLTFHLQYKTFYQLLNKSHKTLLDLRNCKNLVCITKFRVGRHFAALSRFDIQVHLNVEKKIFITHYNMSEYNKRWSRKWMFWNELDPNFQVATCINYWNMVLLPPFSRILEAEFLVPLHVIIFL